jgi:hypothetical protein
MKSSSSGISRIDPASHWALARAPDRQPSFPEYEKVLTSAAAVIVPGLVLAEADYFLRADRKAMRKLMAEVGASSVRYRQGLELDARFEALALGLVDGTVAAIAERRNVYRVDQRATRLRRHPRRSAPRARTRAAAVTAF